MNVTSYDLSPRSRRASARSLGWLNGVILVQVSNGQRAMTTYIVTRFAWMAAKFVSSNNDTKYASAASCRAMTADDWNRRSVYFAKRSQTNARSRNTKFLDAEILTLKSCAISLTNLWKGSFLINNSVDFWYRRISRRATVPGLKR